MKNIALVVKFYLIAIALISSISTSIVYAQIDLQLCPVGFSQGTVTTGFVECYRESSNRSTREEAELERLQREAICQTHPNSVVTSSGIFGTSSGRFFSMVTCTVTRSIPDGTVLCPNDSEEVYRAFDTLVCQNFGNTTSTVEEAQTALNEQVLECTTNAEGQVIETELNEEVFDDIIFFTSSVSCSLTTAATDNIECPFNFSETDRDENTIECETQDRRYETLEEAETASDADKLICADTTAGLGSVSLESMVGITSNDSFFSLVICNITIPRYGDFEDSDVIRVCDATCTEEIEQSRICLNGGIIGGPGCIASSTQIIERRCNTGPSRESLCPLMVTPMTNVIPLLLFDEED